MSKTIRMSLCSVITMILLVPFFCDSAPLIRPSQSIKNSEYLQKYKIFRERNIPNNFCAIKNQTDKHILYLNCSQVKGDLFPLNLTEDGFLHVKKQGDVSTYIAPEQYCVTGRDSAMICPSSASSHFTWRKCCPQNQRIEDVTSNSHSCTNSSIPFRQLVNGQQQSFYITANNGFNLSCPSGYTLKKFTTNACAGNSMSRFQLYPNGTIQYDIVQGVFLKLKERKTVDLSQSRYCLDGVKSLASVANCDNNKNNNAEAISGSLLQTQQWFGSSEDGVTINKRGNDTINLDESAHSISFYPDCGNEGNGGDNTDDQQQQNSILLVCLQGDNNSPVATNDTIRYTTTALALIWLLTCPLLLAAAVGNCCIIQKNVHGWILTCYLLSMFILNVVSVIVIIQVGSGEPEEKGCRPLHFVIKYMYMSTLCWMSSINFGLHKTFRYTLPQAVGYRRFIASVLFSLGFPLFSVTLSYYVVSLTYDQRCEDVPYCMLFSSLTIPYYSFPMLLLVLGNFAIFVKTSYTIASLRKEAEDVLQIQAQDHLKSFALFAKLFLLSGCIWLLRVVLFILHVQGSYLTWYGVMLEAVFSVPEVVFPIVVFHHPEFIKWSWTKAPVISSLVFKINPLFHVPTSK